MITEQELREKLRKITALFERAGTPGERNAAAAAIERVQAALAGGGAQPGFSAPKSSLFDRHVEQPVELKFTFVDQWQKRLFWALCRRYGLDPYQLHRQRHTTVMVVVTRTFLDNVLWPEYLELADALEEYLNDATERIIREEVFGA